MSLCTRYVMGVVTFTDTGVLYVRPLSLSSLGVRCLEVTIGVCLFPLPHTDVEAQSRLQTGTAESQHYYETGVFGT